MPIKIDPDTVPLPTKINPEYRTPLLKTDPDIGLTRACKAEKEMLIATTAIEHGKLRCKANLYFKAAMRAAGHASYNENVI